MKVKCPHCRREFLIPDSTGGRMIKCQCQNHFRASPVEEKSDPHEVALESISESLIGHSALAPIDEETVTSESMTSGVLSEDEVNDYLKDLKKNIEPLKKEGEIATSAPPVMREIEVVEIPKPIQAEPPQENLSLSTDSEILDPERESKKGPSKKQLTKSEEIQIVLEEKFEKAVDIWTEWPLWKKISAPSVLGVVLIAIFLFVTREEEKVEVVDPYLEKLLTKNIPKQSPKKVPAPKPEAPALTKKDPEVSVPKPSPSPVSQSSRILNKLLHSTYLGDFENVIRIASTHPSLDEEEKALFYEAKFARAGKDPSRFKQIALELSRDIQEYGQSSILVRSAAVGLVLQSSSSKELMKAVETLLSLSLTRMKDPSVYAYLGLAYSKLDQSKLAHQAWDQALTIYPAFIWLLDIRGNVYLRAKDYQNAVRMAQHMTQISGFESRGYVRMAEIYESKKDKKQAVLSYREAIKSNDSASIRLALGILLEKEKLGDPIREWEAGLKLKPESGIKRELYYRIARRQCALKKYESALVYFNRAVNEDPRSIPLLRERAHCEIAAGQLARAVQSYEAALSLAPRDESIWLDYGLTLSRIGKTSSSMSALHKSISIKPSDKAHYALALLLLKSGQKKEAASHLKFATRLNPKHSQARALLAKIEPRNVKDKSQELQ